MQERGRGSHANLTGGGFTCQLYYQDNGASLAGVRVAKLPGNTVVRTGLSSRRRGCGRRGKLAQALCAGPACIAGMDATFFLQKEGNTTDRGVLTLLLAQVEAFDSAEGAIRPDLRYGGKPAAARVLLDSFNRLRSTGRVLAAHALCMRCCCVHPVSATTTLLCRCTAVSFCCAGTA